MDLIYKACPCATGNSADASATGNSADASATADLAADYARGCATEDLEEFRRLANASPGIVTHEEPSGRTILHVVAEAGRLNIAQYLLDEEPALVGKIYGEEEYTALHLAAKTGNTDIIRAIINKTFAQNPNAEAINRKTSAGETILHLMAKHGHRKAFTCTLLAHDLRELAKETDQDGNTVLHLSVKRGSIRVVAAVLIATLAFSTLINPPGGVYQDGPLAGKAILSNQSLFHVFVFFNVAASVTSLLIVVIRSTTVPLKRVVARRTWGILSNLLIASTLSISVDYVMAAWMIYRPGNMKNPSILFLSMVVGAFVVGIIAASLYVLVLATTRKVLHRTICGICNRAAFTAFGSWRSPDFGFVLSSTTGSQSWEMLPAYLLGVLTDYRRKFSPSQK
ncbi:putative ankyrin repeat protein [Nymphaea thermarum]|nr:putative ankyrin repeat protein [Nymphaea thermarum]